MTKRAPNNIEGLSSLYDGVTKNLEMINNADSAIESKLAAVLAGSLVVATLVLSRLQHLELLSLFGLFFLATSAAFSLAGAWPRDYPSPTVSVEKHEEYLLKTNRKLLLQLIADTGKSLGKARVINRDKSKAYKISTILFIVGTALSLTSLYIHSVKIQL